MNFQQIMDYLTELNSASILLRLTLAAICGGVIGIERGKKRRPAGLRTHVLVCLGSALVMIVNQYITILSPSADPARLGAQVVSGIGFLGAGTIMVTGRQQVKGLTTAAGLWASACMGLAAGIGFYEGAIVACIFIYGVINVLHKLDDMVISKALVISVYIELAPNYKFSHLLTQLRDCNWMVTSLEMSGTDHKIELGISSLLTLKIDKKMDHMEVLNIIRTFDGVLFVEEV